MNYQKIACWGDSQTFGARTYGCYPLYLAKRLNSSTRYLWQVMNFSTNGHTVRDLWFRLSEELLALRDVHQACILIGTNDVGRSSPIDLFQEYYRQVLVALRIAGIHVAFCGEIPPVWPDGHAFFPAETVERRKMYNDAISAVVADSPIARLVRLPALTAASYTDPVHLNETGNEQIADAFADAIMTY